MASPLEIIGGQKLIADIVNAEGKIDVGTRRVLTTAGQRVRRKQKRLVPKRLRHLERSIAMRSRGTRWERLVTVGPRFERSTKKHGTVVTKYGVFQEFGTSRMAAQPFVRPSIEGEAEKITADLNALMGKLF